MASNKLIPVKMKKEDMQRADVQSFRCGTEQYETPLAEWLRYQSAERIAGGYKVWLYHCQSADGGLGPLVGYGSLTKGKIETSEPGGIKRMVKVMEIPELALHEDFQGCPAGATGPEERYSRQIVRHLQEQARIGQKLAKNTERLLALYVHPHAVKAQRLYLACGFEFAPGRFLSLPEVEPPERGLLGMDYVWNEGE